MYIVDNKKFNNHKKKVFMTNRRKITTRDEVQQRRTDIKQLNLSDISGHSHGEDRNRSMREGFYFRRNRLNDLI